MEIFYHALTYYSVGIVDAALGEGFGTKPAKEAMQFIEELTRSNYKISNEVGVIKARATWTYPVNVMTSLEAKLDAFNNNMRNRRSVNIVNEITTD